ncbi:hypothetical protein B0G80_3635 [Paraburkholderia sp. BL6669N2]|nr:hypothetical protein B0G80_3635 [Paraburkholderia sp. BL6669N2]
MIELSAVLVAAPQAVVSTLPPFDNEKASAKSPDLVWSMRLSPRAPARRGFG